MATVIVEERGHELLEFDTEEVNVGIKVIVQPRQVVVNVSAGGGGGTVNIDPTSPNPIGASAGAGSRGLASDGGHVHAHGQQSAGDMHRLASPTGAGFVPHTSNVQFAALIENPAGVPVFSPIKQSMIAPNFACVIAGGGVLEVGHGVVHPAFTASYVGGSVASAILTDTDGNTPQNVTSTPTSFSSVNTYVKTVNNDGVTFTLSCTATDSETDTSQVSYVWQPLVFWGVAAAGTYNEAFIEALTNSALAGSRSRSFTLNPGATEYIFYGFPTSYGTPTFTVGGFSGGFSLAATANVVNGYGVTENYSLYKSDNPNLGSTTVVVT